MKKIICICLTFCLVSGIYAQKKEELVQKITQLETESTQLKLTIENLQGSIKNVVDANKLLENRIALQEETNKTQASAIEEMRSELKELKKENAALSKQLSEMKRAAVDADPNAIITEPQNEEDSIISLLQQYFGAKKWEDRLPLVYNSESVKSQMATAYKDGYTRTTINKQTVSIPGSNYKVGDIIYISSEKAYIRKTTEGFKIDWEATSGYNATALTGYLADNGTNKIQLRVIADDLASGSWDEYGIGSTYYGFWIQTQARESVACYVSKNSNAGQQISKILKDGKKHNIIIDVYGKKKTAEWDEEGKHFLFLDKIVQEGWAK